jgi:hypothetical protein
MRPSMNRNQQDTLFISSDKRKVVKLGQNYANKNLSHVLLISLCTSSQSYKFFLFIFYTFCIKSKAGLFVNDVHSLKIVIGILDHIRTLSKLLFRHCLTGCLNVSSIFAGHIVTSTSQVSSSWWHHKTTNPKCIKRIRTKKKFFSFYTSIV